MKCTEHRILRDGIIQTSQVAALKRPAHMVEDGHQHFTQFVKHMVIKCDGRGSGSHGIVNRA